LLKKRKNVKVFWLKLLVKTMSFKKNSENKFWSKNILSKNKVDKNFICIFEQIPFLKKCASMQAGKKRMTMVKKTKCS